MDYKIEIGVSVIVHATEDISKIFQSFEDVLNLKKEDFMVSCTTGHFDNPITTLNAKINKKRTPDFMRNLLKRLSSEQISQLVSEIEERNAELFSLTNPPEPRLPLVVPTSPPRRIRPTRIG